MSALVSISFFGGVGLFPQFFIFWEIFPYPQVILYISFIYSERRIIVVPIEHCSVYLSSYSITFFCCRIHPKQNDLFKEQTSKENLAS